MFIRSVRKKYQNPHLHCLVFEFPKEVMKLRVFEGEGQLLQLFALFVECFL